MSSKKSTSSAAQNGAPGAKKLGARHKARKRAVDFLFEAEARNEVGEARLQARRLTGSLGVIGRGGRKQGISAGGRGRTCRRRRQPAREPRGQRTQTSTANGSARHRRRRPILHGNGHTSQGV